MLKRYVGRLACAVLTGLLLLLAPTPARAQSGLAIIPVDRTMWAVKRANVRSGMGTAYTKVGLLEVGEQVRVTGVGAGGKWLRIERPNRRSAFVYAPLLAAAPPQGAPTSTAPAGRQTITYTNARYEGEVRNGKPHGQGTVTWDDSTRYEGEWRNGNRHGQGTFTWKGTGEYAGREGRYEGGWRNDKHHGHGVKVWPNGDRYEGDFVNGKSHGDGLWIAADGEYYLGQFRNGKRHGRGASFQIGGTRYDGEWRNGKAQGNVLITFSSGDIYGGMIRDYKPHGQGVLIFVNGNRYEGEWRNGCFLDGARVAAGISAVDCGFK